MTDLEEIVIFEWTYTPINYFEEPISITQNDFDMIINNGKVEAQLKSKVFEGDYLLENELQKLQNELQNKLFYIFVGAQIESHEKYELSKTLIYRLHQNGHYKEILLPPDPCVSHTSMQSIESIELRKERINKKEWLSDMFEKYYDKEPLVKYLFNSYSMSAKDPDNEFIYFYDIMEALKNRFGGKAEACGVLSISKKSEWGRLGELADNMPVKQGRHRGRFNDSLRNATLQELQEARNIARRLVEGYLKYLESKEKLKIPSPLRGEG